MMFHEDPHVATENPHTFTVQADANGNFTNQQYAPEDQDNGLTYILAATGGTSGRTAQTALTDASGDVTVTPASGGVSISADTAANATSPSWTTLGTITIAESGNNRGAIGSGTLVLKVPDGFEFKEAEMGNTVYCRVGAGERLAFELKNTPMRS